MSIIDASPSAYEVCAVRVASARLVAIEAIDAVPLRSSLVGCPRSKVIATFPSLNALASNSTYDGAVPAFTRSTGVRLSRSVFLSLGFALRQSSSPYVQFEVRASITHDAGWR